MTQTRNSTRKITHGLITIDGQTVPAFEATYAGGTISVIVANGEAVTDAATLATWTPDA